MKIHDSWQTWVRLRIKSWVDLESNAFRFSHELILNRKMGKHFESWANLNQCLGKFFESWIVNSWVQEWVNSWKAAWVISWIDSSLRNTAWVMSSFESRHLSRMPKKRSKKFSESPKSSTKFSGSPKKFSEINSLFESMSHDLIQINIPDSFWVKSQFE